MINRRDLFETIVVAVLGITIITSPLFIGLTYGIIFGLILILMLVFILFRYSFSDDSKTISGVFIVWFSVLMLSHMLQLIGL